MLCESQSCNLKLTAFVSLGHCLLQQLILGFQNSILQGVQVSAAWMQILSFSTLSSYLQFNLVTHEAAALNGEIAFIVEWICVGLGPTGSQSRLLRLPS